MKTKCRIFNRFRLHGSFPKMHFITECHLLHFAWGVAEAKCISVTAASVCPCVSLSLAVFPHYYTDPDVSWGRVGVSFSCALLGGFAIGAWVSLLWQHSAEREMSPCACTCCVPGLFLSNAMVTIFYMCKFFSLPFCVCVCDDDDGDDDEWWEQDGKC